MNLDPSTLIAPLVGQRCWNVKPGYGTFLTLEFGKPQEEFLGPIKCNSKIPKVRALLAKRHVFVHGEWHLWIYCCRWRVLVNDELVGFSDLEGSTKEWMQKAADALEGKTLTEVTLNPQRGTSIFTFSENTQLETEPYDESEQWELFMPDGFVLCYEANGTLRRVHKDEPC